MRRLFGHTGKNSFIGNNSFTGNGEKSRKRKYRYIRAFLPILIVMMAALGCGEKGAVPSDGVNPDSETSGNTVQGGMDSDEMPPDSETSSNMVQGGMDSDEMPPDSETSSNMMQGGMDSDEMPPDSETSSNMVQGGMDSDEMPPDSETSSNMVQGGMDSDGTIPGSGISGNTGSDGTDSDGTPPDSEISGNTGSDATDSNHTAPDSETAPRPSSDSTDPSPAISEYGLELTPVTPLSSGEHYILSWKTARRKQTLRIFDENWECSAVFPEAECAVAGVTDVRYVEICLPIKERKKRNIVISESRHYIQIYDLVRNEFVDFGGKVQGRITILDAQKGYFLDYENITYGEDRDEYKKIRIIDRDGNLVVNHIDEGEEDWIQIYRSENVYVITCHVYSEKDKGMIYRTKLYDSDFNLKAIFYREEEELPEKENRREGVFYGKWLEGAIFSGEGELLVDKERFLARFGNGEDMECSFYDFKIDNSNQHRLYPVTYAGQTWLVDTKLNAYCELGETNLTILDPKEAASYYFSDLGEETYYYVPDGDPLFEVYKVNNTDSLRATGKESYMLFDTVNDGKRLLGYKAEIVVPEDGYHQVHQYEFLSLRSVTCLTPYTIALNGWHAEQYGEMKQELRVYKKDQSLVFRAKGVELSRGQYWDGIKQKYDNSYVVSMWDGEEQGTGKRYAYTVLGDGEVRATIPAMGQMEFCYGGCLQMKVGEEIHVYDYDGNRIIRVFKNNAGQK